MGKTIEVLRIGPDVQKGEKETVKVDKEYEKHVFSDQKLVKIVIFRNRCNMDSKPGQIVSLDKVTLGSVENRAKNEFGIQNWDVHRN